MSTITDTNRYGIPPSKEVTKKAAHNIREIYGLNYPVGKNMGKPAIGTNLDERKTGGYFNKRSGVQLVRNNVEQLLRTLKGERVMLPDFGLALQKYLFEPLDEITIRMIKTDIITSIEAYIPYVKIVSLFIGSDTSDKSNIARRTGGYAPDNNTLNIILTLQIQDESMEIFDVGVKIK